MFEWLRELLDRDYLPVKKWKRDAKFKKQFLVLIWNSPEKRIRPVIVPSHTSNILQYICDAMGEQEYFTEHFDYREKKRL